MINVGLISVTAYSAFSIFVQRLVFTTFVYLTLYKNTAILPLGANENAEWAVTYTRQTSH
jgi:hypothetical protein